MPSDLSSPWEHRLISDEQKTVIEKIYFYVQEYFKDPRFDASHDFAHVERVVHNAIAIFESEQARAPTSELDIFAVILGALLHDVGDKKYVNAGDDAKPVTAAVLRTGLPQDFARRIQLLCDNVSYSNEVKNPQRVRDLLITIPELAVVQDADRLDAIGAIGIGRCFTFGGAKGARSLDDSIEHFKDKLLKLEDMMKTESGRKMAADRSSRIREFMSWWGQESGWPAS